MLPWLRARRFDLTLLTALAVAFAPLFQGRVIWLRDLARWVAPSRHALRDALSVGEIPRWDHLQGVGVPLPANPLHGVFYPPTLLSLLEPIPWWCSAYLLAHVAFGALGLARLSRRLGTSPEGAALAGLAWALSGPTLSEWTAGIRLPSLCWTPWIALGLGAVAREPGLRALPRLALPVGLALLAGEPFMVLFAMIFSAATLPATDAWPALTRERLARVALAATAGVALGALLASASLAPVLGALSGTQRAANLSDAEALGWSVPFRRLVDQLVLGGYSISSLLDADAAARAVTGPLPLLYWHYLGASVLALAAMGVGRDRRSAALLGALLLATLLALGEHTPLYRLAQFALPPLRRMRSPEKFLALSAMSVALLAGVGLDALRASPRRAARAALVALALGAVLATPYASASLTRRMHEAAALALVGLAALAPAALAAWRAPRYAPWLAVAAVLFDLARVGGTVPLWTSLVEARWRSPVLEPARALRGPTAPLRIYRAHTLGEARHQPPGLEGARRRFASLPPNTSRSLGVGMLPAYDVAASPALDALLAMRRADVLALLSVDAALQPARETERPGLRALPRVFSTFDLLAVEAALPRVYPVAQTRTEAHETPDASTLQPEVLRGERALVPAGAILLDGAPGRAGRCELERVRNGRIDARCVLDRAAHVVFVEQFAPGWSATVDGVSTPVLRTNALLMGVRARAGARRVALRYDPPGMRLGLGLSLLALAAIGAIAWRRGTLRAG